MVLGDFVFGHTTSSILDAATANSATAGGVSILSNGSPPPPAGQDGLGGFKAGVPLPGVPGGQGETAIVTADLDGNGIPDIVAADPGKQTIDVWVNVASSSGFTVPFSLPMPSGSGSPIALVVDSKFRGNGLDPDIAVLTSNGSIVIFENGITHGTPSAADFTSHSCRSRCRTPYR